MDKKEELELFHRARILTASRELFGEKDKDLVTMDDIAHAADYSKATLYVYFKNKDEIYNIILLDSMRHLYKQLVQVIDNEKSAMHQYVAACLVLSKYYEENPHYYKSILEIMTRDQELQNRTVSLDRLYQVSEDMYTALGAIFQNGILDNSFRADTPELSSSLIYFAALSGIIELVNNKHIYIRRRTGMSKDEFLKFGFRMMLRSVLKDGIKSEQ